VPPLKERPKGLPQIDAQFEFDPSSEYADEVIGELLRYYTLDQISNHAGVCRRSVSYMRHRGFPTYPVQLSMEILCFRRELVER
jgi:hypothetical protein